MHEHGRPATARPARGGLSDGGGTAAPGAVEEAQLELVVGTDEIAHLVCCRDAVWRVAFCGEEQYAIDLTAEVVCSMCMEEVLKRVPDMFEREHPLCPKDLRDCPDEHEIDLEILRRVSASSPPPVE